MQNGDTIHSETIAYGFAGYTLWKPAEAVAEAAVPILEICRELAPVGERLLSLPDRWTKAHQETLFLFSHLAETLGSLRPQARLILEAFGEEPSAAGLPDFREKTLFATMIQRLDSLEPVAALPEDSRSLFPLHAAEISGYAQGVVQLEKWILKQSKSTGLIPRFLWKLAFCLENEVARSHIFDRSKAEPGILTLIGTILRAEGREGEE